MKHFVLLRQKNVCWIRQDLIPRIGTLGVRPEAGTERGTLELSWKTRKRWNPLGKQWCRVIWCAFKSPGVLQNQWKPYGIVGFM